MLGDGFDIEIKPGHSLGGPCVVKDNVFEAQRRCCECCFLGGDGSAVKTRGSFDLDFLLGVGQLGSCHQIFDGCLLNESKSMDAPFN